MLPAYLLTRILRSIPVPFPDPDAIPPGAILNDPDHTLIVPLVTPRADPLSGFRRTALADALALAQRARLG